MNTAATASVTNRDVQIISMIGLAHATSHFFHLLLPSLFPFFARDFGFSFASLGLLTTVFFVVSGIGQALSGFLVDRYGATRILTIGLSCFAIGALIVSQASGYAGLVLGAVALGMGNAVFHPVDYTIINRRVSSPRLGHAYSTHGITGNLGWAVSPLFVLAIAGLSSWRVAALCAAVLAVAVMLLALSRRADLFVAPTWANKALQKTGDEHAHREHALAFMRLPAVWLCFGFFFASAITLGAIQNFSVPALKALFGMPLEQATLALSAYLVCSALGMFAGGFVLAHAKRMELVIAVGMGIGVLVLAILATMHVMPAIAMMLMIVSGFGVGISGPSRDLLIKKSTPAGSSGRVYGTVYSGLDIGLSTAPLMLGIAMDKGKPEWVFALAAAALVLAIVFAALLGARIIRAASSISSTSLHTKTT